MIYFIFLFRMTDSDEYFGGLFWMTVSDDFSGWLFWMTVRDSTIDSCFSDQFVFPRLIPISTNHSADWSHDWFVFERQLPTVELWPRSPPDRLYYLRQNINVSTLNTGNWRKTVSISNCLKHNGGIGGNFELVAL